MKFQPLSAAVRGLWKLLERLPRSGSDELDAAALYLAHCEGSGVEPFPGDVWINAAALAVALAPSPTVHAVRPEAVRLAHETDTRAWPGEAPELLRGAGLVEASDWRTQGLGIPWGPQGETVSLGWYYRGGRLWVVGLSRTDGARASSAVIHWGSRDDVAPAAAWACDERDAASTREWLDASLSWLCTLALLLDAHESPARVRQERPEPTDRRPRRGTTHRPPVAWSTRTVYLATPPPSTWPGRSTQGQGATLDTAGRAAGLSTVTGHLRLQPYGPGGSLRRWQYVEAYEARRWYLQRPEKIVVR